MCANVASYGRLPIHTMTCNVNGRGLQSDERFEVGRLKALSGREESLLSAKICCRELLQVSKKQNDVENERRDTEHNERLVIRFAPSECAEE
jgi:hypothetical protein